jgi:hypothetical protein
MQEFWNNVQEAEDVFDPSCYGEEEFGPEEEVKVKPARKKREAKKKETKAIIGQHVNEHFF